MKVKNWAGYKRITPSEAIKKFIQSYASTMHASLQIIVTIVNDAKRDVTHASMNSCLKQASITITDMKIGLELMRRNILARNRKHKNA